MSVHHHSSISICCEIMPTNWKPWKLLLIIFFRNQCDLIGADPIFENTFQNVDGIFTVNRHCPFGFGFNKNYLRSNCKCWHSNAFTYTNWSTRSWDVSNHFDSSNLRWKGVSAMKCHINVHLKDLRIPNRKRWMSLSNNIFQAEHNRRIIWIDSFTCFFFKPVD